MLYYTQGDGYDSVYYSVCCFLCGNLCTRQERYLDLFIICTRHRKDSCLGSVIVLICLNKRWLLFLSVLISWFNCCFVSVFIVVPVVVCVCVCAGGGGGV